MILLTLAALYAADLPPGVLPPPWSYLVQYGPAALFAGMLVTRKFAVPSWALSDAEARIAALTAERNAAQVEVREKNQLIQDKYVPSLEAARVASESMLTYLQTVGGAASGP